MKCNIYKPGVKGEINIYIMNLGECERRMSWPILKHSPDICTEELTEINIVTHRHLA
jgi:hypothetical protein